MSLSKANCPHPTEYNFYISQAQEYFFLLREKAKEMKENSDIIYVDLKIFQTMYFFLFLSSPSLQKIED